jgi:NitT/TauT family transport system ATP-binding protein
MEGKVDAVLKRRTDAGMDRVAVGERSAVGWSRSPALPPGVSVKISGLTKEFDMGDRSVVAIDRLDLAVRDGEFLCIVGPSGCGKTTLIRTIAGLETQTNGTIWMKPPANRRPLTAMVFQTDSVFPWMTVEDNVGYGLKMQGVSKSDRDAKVQSLLRVTGLEKFGKSYPHQLSGGMRQRVNVARAFAADPEILLMDEPFGLLDEQNRMILQKELMDIWRESRKTTLFITHSVDEAILLGDRILVMTAHPGRVKEIIDIDIPRPRDLITLRGDARFISLYKQVWALLSEEVLRSRAQETPHS